MILLYSPATTHANGRRVGVASRETPRTAAVGVNRSRACDMTRPAVRTWDTSVIGRPCIASALSPRSRRRAAVHLFVIETKGNAYLVTPITGRSAAGDHSPEGNARVVHLDRRAPAHPDNLILFPYSPVVLKPVINDRDPESPPMAQRKPKAGLMLDLAYLVKKDALQQVTHQRSPGGVQTTPEEWLYLQRMEQLITMARGKATDDEVAVSVVHNGLFAPRTRRLLREAYGDDLDTGYWPGHDDHEGIRR